MKFKPLVIALFSVCTLASAQRPQGPDYQLALTDHKGQLRWHADGFKIIQSSAKPGGHEVGIRGSDNTGRLTFLGFLFLAPEGAPQSSAKCRDQALSFDKKSNPALKVLRTSELTPTSSSPSVKQTKIWAQSSPAISSIPNISQPSATSSSTLKFSTKTKCSRRRPRSSKKPSP